MTISICVAAYCLMSGICQFVLGMAWHGFNPVHRAIKYLFLFSSVWGVFLGAFLIRSLL